MIEPALLTALAALPQADLTAEELSAWSEMICEIGAIMMQETILKSA